MQGFGVFGDCDPGHNPGHCAGDGTGSGTRLPPSASYIRVSRNGSRENLQVNAMKITVTQNGPNMLETDKELTAVVGGMEKKIKSPCFVCRCGALKNKPFCNGSHLAAKFEAPAAEIRGKNA
jgi:CDGSH-type Zn-finger protein